MSSPRRAATSVSGWRYALSVCGQAAGYSLGSAFIYTTWREKELGEIKAKAVELCKCGVLRIDSPISSTQKRTAWVNNLKPAMVQHWKTTLKCFDPADPSTWPQLEHGKCHEASSTNNKVPGLPRLTSDNYLLQAVALFMIDPKLEGQFHFGSCTHPKLLLLMNPLSLVTHKLLGFASSSSTSDTTFALEGSDQSWHLANLPNKKHGKEGQPIPWAAHIDGGESNAYQKPGGKLPAVVPPSPSSPALSSEEKLLHMLLHQLCILFHCETPGDLLPAQGATGFYSRSHLFLLLALAEAGAGAEGGILWPAHVQAIRQVGRDCQDTTLQQVSLPDNQQAVAFGLTMHTAMWAVEGMGKQGEDIRVIQNAKVKAASSVRLSHELQAEFIRKIPEEALLRVLARGDAQEWRRVLGVTEEEWKEAQALKQSYLRYAKLKK